MVIVAIHDFHIGGKEIFSTPAEIRKFPTDVVKGHYLQAVIFVIYHTFLRVNTVFCISPPV